MQQAACTECGLLDHRVGAGEQSGWNRETKRLGGLEVECAAERHEKKGGQQHELKKNVSYSCVKDEGGPLGIGFQERVPNHSKRLRSKAVVVSVGTKVRGMTSSRCAPGIRAKANHSVPRRNVFAVLKT